MLSLLEKYTVAFVFNKTLTKVLLVHKQRPDWQKGRVNGVGGKYQPGESAEACIKREATEETGLVIAESHWIRIGTIDQQAGNVGVLATRYRGKMSDANSMDHEQVEWFDLDDLPDNVINNLRWLIPLSLDKLKNDDFVSFEVRY